MDAADDGCISHGRNAADDFVGGDARMKITVLGGDGYCGWATALYLSNRATTCRSWTTLRGGSGTTNSASRR